MGLAGILEPGSHLLLLDHEIGQHRFEPLTFSLCALNCDDELLNRCDVGGQPRFGGVEFAPLLCHCLLCERNMLSNRQRILLKAADSGPIGGVPDSDFPGPVTGDQTIGFVAVGNRQPHISERVKRPLLASVGFPDLCHFVATDRHDPAIASELNGSDTAAMGPPVFQQLPIFQLVEPDLAVLTRRGQHIGIRSPGNARDRSRMGFDRHVVAAAEGFPEKHAAAAVRCGEEYTVRGVGHRLHPVGVLGVLKLEFARLSRIHPHHPLGTTKGDQPLVWRHVGSKDHVEFFTNLLHTAATAEIPDDHLAAGSTDAAACQHKTASTAETHDVRATLWEREHALKVQRVGVKEEHLTLPRHGSHRPPRACRDRRTGIEGRGVDGGLQWQPRRLWNDLRPLHR